MCDTSELVVRIRQACQLTHDNHLATRVTAISTVAQGISLFVALLQADAEYYATNRFITSCPDKVGFVSTCCLDLHDAADLQLVSNFLGRQPTVVQALACIWLASSARVRREAATDSRQQDLTSWQGSEQSRVLLAQLHLQLQNQVLRCGVCAGSCIPLAAVAALEELYHPHGCVAVEAAELVGGWSTHVARVARDVLLSRIATTLQQVATNSTEDCDLMIPTASPSQKRAAMAAELWAKAAEVTSRNSANKVGRMLAPEVSLAVSDISTVVLARYLAAVGGRWGDVMTSLFQPLDASNLLQFLRTLPMTDATGFRTCSALEFRGLVITLENQNLVPNAHVQDAKAFLQSCTEHVAMQLRQCEQDKSLVRVNLDDDAGKDSVLSRLWRNLETESEHVPLTSGDHGLHGALTLLRTQFDRWGVPAP
jgi:hypothetical protein